MQGRAMTDSEAAECSQRAMGSVQAVKAGMKGPVGVGQFEGWDQGRQDWVSANNPCSDGAAAAPVMDAAESDDFVRTRARMLLESGQPGQAREALLPVFDLPTERDDESYGIISRASEALAAADSALEEGMCKVIDPVTKAPLVVWRGRGAVELRCRLAEGAVGSGQLRLIVRKRIRATQRQIVWVNYSMDRTAREQSVSLELPLTLDDAPAGASAYYTLYAEEVRPEMSTAVLARGELFWFAPE
jgi:hypothetical protein